MPVPQIAPPLPPIKLNQLEEKQRVPESYFAADLRRAAVNFGQRQCRSFSSALQEVHIKGTLMDRLRLLENRILQVGYELDKGSGSSSSTSTSAKSSDESTWMLNPKSCKSDDATPQHHGEIRGSPKKTGDRGFQRSGGGGGDGCGVSNQLQTNKSLSKKVKDTKDGCKTAEKKGSRSQNGKKRVDHSRTYKRWFGLGC
ncbi:hypothetical protein QJS10_CPA10g00016 [Acorus calamus]|uniref:Uncharacterized protein n=1 Tax=Acorus calamus TaxID=4465 RepID=A0AAV9DX58_ACOCL|nr:hypothetical protein QJS10_CPA10g00016 [Acorus calamus]